MKLCIRAHDLATQTVSDAAQALCGYGLDGLQTVCYKAFAGIEYRTGQMNAEKARGIDRCLKEAGKATYLVGAYFNPVHPDAKKADNGIAVFKEYLEFCNDLGCNTVGSETGSFNGDKWTYNPQNRTADALNAVTKTFAALCEYADKFNANVAVEGAAGHICYNPDTLNALVKDINAKNLRIIFDLYNYLEESNCGDYLKILNKGLDTFKQKIHCFHLKDFCLQDGKLKQVPPGKGIIDYEAVLKGIKSYDADAVLILEGTTGGDIQIAADYIKEVWNGV